MLLTSNLLNARKHLCQLADIPRQTLIFQLSSRFTCQHNLDRGVTG